MKRICLFLFLLFMGFNVAQAQNPSAAKRINYGTPPGSCNPATGDVFMDTTTTPPDLLKCDATGKWARMNTGGVRTVTGTTDTFLASDRSKLVNFNNDVGVASTLPQATAAGDFLSGWTTYIFNSGVGVVTITPTTSTINGTASISFGQNEGGVIFSNGTDYVVLKTATVGASSSAPQVSQIVSGGEVIWESAYQFRVSAATYYIQGVLHSSAEQTITLDAADGTNDRIDVIALNTSGTVVKITGTAAAQPSEPDIDPATQLKLTFVYVTAASSAPGGVTNENIYLEGVEWTASTSGTGWTLDSTNNPRTGTKDVEGTSVANGAYVQFQRASATTLDGYNTLNIYIRSKAAWANNRILRVQFYNAGVAKGTALTIASGFWGFSSSTTGVYQLVAIPVAQFVVPAGTQVNQLRITDSGGSIGLYMDDIVLQTSSNTVGGGSSGGTITSIDATGGVETVTGVPITDTGTIRGTSKPNIQTGTSYTILSTDRGRLITHSNASATADTLPQAGASFPNGWFVDIQNRGAGAVTVTPTTSTVDGGASIVINQNEGVRIVSDGTNYFTMRGKGAGGGSGITINATDGTLPYRSNATTFADSYLIHQSGVSQTFSNSGDFALSQNNGKVMGFANSGSAIAFGGLKASGTGAMKVVADSAGNPGTVVFTTNTSIPTPGGNPSPWSSQGMNYRVTLTTASTTLGNPGNHGGDGTAPDGYWFILQLVQDATGGRTVTWSSDYRFIGGSAPTLSTAANAVDTFTFVCYGDIAYEVSRSLQAASSGITGTLTAPRIPFASGTSTLTTHANLSWDTGTNQQLNVSNKIRFTDSTRSATIGWGGFSWYFDSSGDEISIGGSAPVYIHNNKWVFETGGTFKPYGSDGGFDIGSTGAGGRRVRSIYLANSVEMYQSTNLTSSLPFINHTATWNNSGVVFTNFKSNVTDTASDAASLLMDLQVGGTSKFKVDKGGNITVTSCTGCGGGGATINPTDTVIPFRSNSTTFADSPLRRVDANTLQQSNAGNANQLYIYMTTDSDSSPVNYERARIGTIDATNVGIAAQAGGTGSQRDVELVRGSVSVALRSGVFQPSNNGVTNLGGSSNAWAQSWFTDILAYNSGSTAGGRLRFYGSSGNAAEIASDSNRRHIYFIDGTTNNPYGTIEFKGHTITTLSANQNNYSVEGNASGFMRWSSNADGRTVTGLSLSQADGEVHQIHNVGANTIILANESVSSTAANRFHTNTGSDITIPADGIVDLIYDGTTQRYRASLRAATSGSGSSIAPLQLTDANTVEQYNSTNPQSFCVYGTRTSSTNYERGCIRFASNTYEIIAEKGSGGGTQRNIRLSAKNTSGFNTNTVEVTPTALTSPNNDMVISGFNGLTMVQSSTIGWSSGASMTGSNSSVVFNNTYAGCIGSPGAFASGTTNDPDFSSACLTYRLTPNAAGSTLTGGRDIAGGQAGEHHELFNIGSGPLILANQNTGSSSGRRWITANNLDMNIGANQGAQYVYDSTSGNLRIGRWQTSETYNVTTQFDKTNTTLADVTGLSTSVIAGRTYNFVATLYVDADATGGYKFAIGGSATATSIVYNINALNNGSGAYTITSRQTALAGAAGAATGTGLFVQITGTITVNAAGTLTVQFAQNAANGTSSVLVGSSFYVNNIN